MTRKYSSANNATPLLLKDVVECNSEKEHNQEETHQTWIAYTWAILGVIALVVGLASAQALNKTIPHSQLNGFRFTAQFLMTSPLLIGLKRCDVRLDRDVIGWVVLSSVVLVCNSYAHYGATYYIPLGVTSGIAETSTLLLTYFVQCLWTRRIHWYDIVTAVICVAGVFLVIGIVPGYTIDTAPKLQTHLPCTIQNVSLGNATLANDSSDQLKTMDTIIGYVISGVAGFTGATYVILIRTKLPTLNILQFNFWSSLIGIVLCFVIMAPSETPRFPTSPACLSIFFVHIISAGLQAILCFHAYQVLEPFTCSVILTLEIALNFILQYTLMSTFYPGRADAAEICGAVMIFVGNTIVPIYHVIKERFCSSNDEC